MTGRICLACWEFCLFHEQSPYKTALPLGFNLGGFCMITSEPCFTQGSIRAAGKKSKGSGFVKRITSPFKSKAVFFFFNCEIYCSVEESFSATSSAAGLCLLQGKGLFHIPTAVPILCIQNFPVGPSIELSVFPYC